jgi:type 1 glutamine amidotransferase
MRSPHRFFPAFALASFAAVLRAEPGHVFAPLQPEEIQRIEAAVPAIAPATPERPRRVLIFYRTEGFVHKSIAHARVALRRLGERTGAFTSEESEDMAAFAPESLARFDAVVFVNTTKLKFENPTHRAALLEFVRGGKGVAGLHAATDNFYDWPEAQACLGGLFRDHPWNAKDVVAVKLDDPRHPVVAAFGEGGFWIRDEIYQIAGPYARDRQRVLLSLDMSHPENERPPEKLFRADRDFPIAWVKGEGRGRVFYSSLGHNPDVFMTPEPMRHFLAGLQFALGDLAADVTLSAALNPAPTPALAPIEAKTPLQDKLRAATLPAIFPKIAAYDFGHDRAATLLLDAFIAEQGPAIYPQVEASFLKLLADPTLPDGARDYALRKLTLVGSRTAIDPLVVELNNEKTAPLALDALVALARPEAARALLAALSRTAGQAQIGVIGALGAGRVESAVKSLEKLTASPDETVARAALDALSAIGTRTTLEALRGAKVAPPLAESRHWALAAGANRLVSAEKKSRADLKEVEAAARFILAEKAAAPPLRVAALRAWTAARDEDAWPPLLAALGGEDAALRLAVAPLAGGIVDTAWRQRLAAAFFSFDAAVQIAVLHALAAAPSPEVTRLVRTLAEVSAVPEIKALALRLLGDFGDATTCALLIKNLAAEAPLGAGARAGFARLAPAIAHAPLRAALADSTLPPATRAALYEVIAARAEREFFPAVYDAAMDASLEAEVRAAAVAAAGALASRDDLPKLIELLPRARTAAERRDIELNLVAAVRVSAADDAVARLLIARLPSAPPEQSRVLLLALAAQENPTARAFFAEATTAPDAARRRGLLRFLGASENPAWLPLLLARVSQPLSPEDRALALRAYLSILSAPGGPATSAQVDHLRQKIWPVLSEAADKAAVLARLKAMGGERAAHAHAELQKEFAAWHPEASPALPTPAEPASTAR